MTNEERALLFQIKTLVEARQYRTRIHAVRHMIEEGFTEHDLIDSILGRSRILEDYSADRRCLLLCYFHMNGKVRCPLHVVCDYTNDEVVDIVTAYIPEKPWWSTATKRGP